MSSTVGRLAGVLVAAVALAVPACGGEPLQVTYPEVTAAPLPTTTTTVATTTTSTTSTTTTTTTSPRTSSTVDQRYADYCRRYAKAQERVADAEPGKDRLARTKKELRDLAKAAPAPIRKDLATYSAWVQEIGDEDGLDRSDAPGPVRQAGDRLDTWHEATCGTS